MNLFYLSTLRYRRPMELYLRSKWGLSKKDWIVHYDYDSLAEDHEFLPGTYIFGDLECLQGDLIAKAERIWQQLNAVNVPVQILNKPGFTLTRFDLLKTLHARGINEFTVHRLEPGFMPEKFPVYIRREQDHKGNRTPLLYTPEEFEQAALKVIEEFQSQEGFMVTEFCDTRDAQGIYRKYSAFIVGNKVIARHVFFSREWMIKKADLKGPDFLNEEMEYVSTHPQCDDLAHIFSLAHIQYGRMDYGVKNGKIQVWEINTNPTILRRKFLKDPERIPVHQYFADQLDKALDQLRQDSTCPAR